MTDSEPNNPNQVTGRPKGTDEDEWMDNGLSVSPFVIFFNNYMDDLASAYRFDNLRQSSSVFQ